ncbi:hypothetical protein GYMLUDRAFT_244622 [Collybiopsis luxurians FD-317 M1]|uniref:NB-ARC domain-containing protein n=1 Tax=Collybiopsis luxurians FD-317 M1 TaxID=944289 RepID=A0A0D0BX01_9AGAR|nr:hypothetical protein GYMLUDRAFT_244622 [Collybiopsis luxurians FD-317 M1]
MAQKKESSWRKFLQFSSGDKKSKHKGPGIAVTPQHAEQSTVPTNSSFSGAFFSGAQHVHVSGGEFYHIQGNQNITNVLNTGRGVIERASKVLVCPTPSQYFVGREDIISQITKVFSPPVVTLYSSKKEEIEDFIRNNMKWCTVINLDASSVNALQKAFTEKVKGPQDISENSVLVFENGNPSLGLQDRLPGWACAPIVITSYNQDMAKKVCGEGFEIPNSTNWTKIKELAKAVKSKLQSKQHVVTIVAAGGTGKTQVILNFVADNFERFSNVWFFDASSDATLVEDFKKLANTIGVGESVESVKGFLASTQENWLCIFDNADDREVVLKNYIPACNHGNIIVTSRFREMAQVGLPENHIDLGDLDRDSAVKLLLKHAHVDPSKDDYDLAHVHIFKQAQHVD